MFGGGEEGLPVHNLTGFTNLISHIWHKANGGYPAILHLSRIPHMWLISKLYEFGINALFLQIMTFILLISTGTLAMFKLTREFVSNNKTSFVSSLFYLFNPYSMSQIWSRGIYAQFFAFALVPAFLYLYIRGLKSKNVIYISLAILTSFILSSAYVVITNVIVLWIPVLLYLVIFLFDNREKKRLQLYSLLYTAILLIFWGLSNSWWLLPTISTASSAYYHFLTGANNLDSLRGMSQMYFKPQWVIRLYQGFIFFLSNAYDNAYSHLSFRLLGWLTPLVAFCSVVYLKTHKTLWFVILLWIIGFSFSIGTNLPTGAIFTWFFTNFQFLQAFRNPYEKAGLLLMLPYSILFSFGWSWIFKKSRIVALAILIGVCGVLVWPMWTGRVLNAWVKVPKYYKEADSWISSQNGDFKIIQMPLVAGDGVRYDWQNTYQGIEPSEFLFTISSIGRNVAFNKIYYNILLQRFGIFSPGSFGPDPDTSLSEFRSKELWEELVKLGVRFIVFHRDYDQNTVQSNSLNTKENLEQEKNIKYLRTYGKLDIYEVLTPQPTNRLYSPNTKLETTKLSVDLYKVKIINATESAIINLLDLYDPDWELYIDNQKVSTHNTVLGYANGWILNKTGDYEATVRYSPQDYVWLGWKVSLATLILVFICIIASKLYVHKI
jgi:hypothetical protein